MEIFFFFLLVTDSYVLLETEKRLIGAALNGHPIIALDNCNSILRGDFLCQVTERPTLGVRRRQIIWL